MLNFIGGVFLFLFYGILILGMYGAAYDNYIRWKQMKDRELPKKSKTSNDFIEERSEILRIIESRLAFDVPGNSFLSKDEREQLYRLWDSSEIASLVRYAHYAGYHLTFEANECSWEDDCEYFNPNVFKTDMGEAKNLREERYWNRYKRYFDPPKSKRDRALKTNDIDK